MYLPFSSTGVRLVLRLLFTLLFFHLGIFGDWCNKLSIKLRLLRDGSIPVAEAGGWLQGGAVFAPIWHTRRLPKVHWWGFMLLVLLLSKVDDLATATVRNYQLPSQCQFDHGMILNLSGREVFDGPPFNARSALVAGNAQITSFENGCDQGIYHKVNDDSTFCALATDIYGSWTCEPNGEDITYAARNFTTDDICNDLIARGVLLSGNYSANADVSETDSHDWSHLVVWQSTIDDNSYQLFDVMASVDISASADDDTVMHSMTCRMHAPDVEAIMKNIPSVTTLSNWVPLYQGYMYNGYGAPAVNDIEDTLSWYLNTLIMVAGGSDYLLATPSDDDSFQGCLIYVTLLPDWLAGLLCFTVFLCVLTTIFAAILRLRLHMHPNRALVKNTPVDLYPWMVHAATESTRNPDGVVEAVCARDLHLFHLDLTGGSTMQIVRRGVGVQATRYEKI